MIDTLKLKAAIVGKGYTQKEIAKKLNITDKTFYLKMKKGVFNSNEINLMIQILSLQDPVSIFFTKTVT